MTDVPTTALTNADLAPAGVAITTGAVTFTSNANVRCCEITTGGTGGAENIILPLFTLDGAGWNASQMGQRCIFYLKTQTNENDIVNISLGDSSGINVYLGRISRPGSLLVDGPVVLGSEGEAAVFVWCGQSWCLDQAMTRARDECSFISEAIEIQIPNASGGLSGGDIVLQPGSATGTGGGGNITLIPGTASVGSPGTVIMANISAIDPHVADAAYTQVVGGKRTVILSDG